MSISVRNEGAKVNSNINVTPMVDVMLVLLIIFMVITPMLQNKVNIDLAKTDNPTSMPDADKEDAIVVAVENKGSISTVLRKARQHSIAVLTWDADAEPDARDFFLNQATPEGIANALTDEAARLLPPNGQFAMIYEGSNQEPYASLFNPTATPPWTAPAPLVASARLNFPASGSAPPCWTTAPVALSAGALDDAETTLLELAALVVVTAPASFGALGAGSLAVPCAGSEGLLLQATAASRRADAASPRDAERDPGEATSER